MDKTNDFSYFKQSFDIIENALNMRTLIRWNGRDLQNKENLAEHTHLVTACAIQMLDNMKIVDEPIYLILKISYDKIIKLCMMHDSLELLRGDILSVTKDIMPGLRDAVDREEQTFLEYQVGETPAVVKDFVHLADLLACYKFVEWELRRPSNDFAKYAYLDTKSKFDCAWAKFKKDYFIVDTKNELSSHKDFAKGYASDAGYDIILKDEVTIMPMSTQTLSLNVTVPVKDGEMGIICSRTSAANKGLIVALCPVDPNYTGQIMAIVHNISNEILTYREGESFCQLVMLPVNDAKVDYDIKKIGKRSDGALGSTDK